MISAFHQQDGKRGPKAGRRHGGNHVPKKHGAVKVEVTPEMIEKFKELLIAGWSLDYAAVQSGMGRSLMSRRRKENPEFDLLCKTYRVPAKRASW